MALIDDLSGLSGENLASALLSHLLLRSEVVRRSITRLLSDRSPIGPIIVNRHFSSYLEVCTKSGKRIDLLIQTDDAVIGVEVKFNAGFQEGQPQSYLALVQEKADELGSVWDTTFQPMLVVLAPERRRNEIEQEISNQEIEDHCVFVAWQDLLSVISWQSLPSLPAVDRFLVEELDQFVRGLVGYVDLDRLACHLDKKWHSRGSAVVRELIDKVIWSLLDERLRQSYNFGGGISFYGYYLLRKDQEPPPWIGFIDAEELRELDEKGAILMIAFRDASEANELNGSPLFRRVAPRGWELFHCAAAEKVATWTDLLQWEKAMRGVNAALTASDTQAVALG